MALYVVALFWISAEDSNLKKQKNAAYEAALFCNPGVSQRFIELFRLKIGFYLPVFPGMQKRITVALVRVNMPFG